MLRGQEDRDPFARAARGHGAKPEVGHARGARDIALRALFEGLRSALHLGHRDAGGEFVEDLLLVLRLRDPEPRGEVADGALRVPAMRGEEPAKVPPLPGEIREEVVEGLRVGAQHQARERRAERGLARRVVEHAVARAVEQRAGLVVVGDREAHAHARLDGEAAQQRLAEGMDGLDAHAARRVDRGGEEAARARLEFRVDRDAVSREVGEVGAQLLAGHRRPRA